MNSDDLEQIMTWSDDLYRFVMITMDYMKQPHDYGTGEVLNMVEMHTLSMIAGHPGICVSDVAKMWNRTLSAASRNVDRLHAKGYIEKKKLEGNDKNVHLYVTAHGRHLADLHHDYDLQAARRLFERMMQQYSMTDLKMFFSILYTLQDFFQSVQKK